MNRGALSWLLGGLLAIAVGGGLAALIAHDPGHVYVAYDRFSIEMSFWVGLVLLAGLWLVVRTCGRFWSWLVRGGRGMRGLLSGRRARIARNRTSAGLLALAQGDLESARDQLSLAAADADEPLMNYLNAARIAQLQGDAAAARSLLDQAAQLPDTGTAVTLMRAGLLAETGHAAQALRVLQPLATSRRPDAGILRALVRCQRQLTDTTALAELLPLVRKHKALSASEIADIEAEVLVARLRGASGDGDRLHARAGMASVRTPDVKEVTRLWKAAGRVLQARPDVVAACARAHALAGAPERAEALLRDAVDARFDATLAGHYASVFADTGKQLEVARRWRDSHGHEPALLLAVGRLAARAGRHDEARECIEESLRLSPSTEAMCELARLSMAAGDPAAAVTRLLSALESSAVEGTSTTHATR